MPPSLPAPVRLTAGQFWSYRTFLFDADGCLWLEDRPLPGVLKLFDRLYEKGRQVFIVTNNSSRNLDNYAEKLKKLGFKHLTRNNVINPILPLIQHLRTKNDDRRVYLVAGFALQKALQDAGVKAYGAGPAPFTGLDQLSSEFPEGTEIEKHAAVIASFDPDFSYIKLTRAATALAADKSTELLITNEDATFPSNRQHIVTPGTGCMAAAVRKVTNKTPVVFGKPERHMFDQLQREHGVLPEQTIMFGDRLDTDIAFGRGASLAATCLIETGVHKEADAKEVAEKGIQELTPHFVLQDFEQILLEDD